MGNRGRNVILVVSITAIVLLGTTAAGMTVDIPAGGEDFIKVGEDWRFFRGREAASDPADAWKELDLLEGPGWESGPSGFGYGDNDDATELRDMEGNYVTVYIRKEFSVTFPVEGMLQLVIDYDDGFIAYLNGDLLDSRHMPPGIPTFETEASSHEAGSPITIPLGRAEDLLREGKNVLAIEGHNAGAGSTDFSLIPALRRTTDIVKDGPTWIVGTPTTVISGTAPIPQTVSVLANNSPAEFNSADGTWRAEISLSAGTNEVTVEAFDAEMSVVDAGTAEILYIPPSRRLSGELTEETVWSPDPSPYVVEETVVVEAGVVLRIEPGTTVMLQDSASLIVFGQLLAEGTEDSPITFTHYGDGSTWGNIVFDGAEPSRLVHSIVEYSSSGSSYAGKDYIAAVAVVGCHLDIDGGTFHKLPEESATAEGDAVDLSNGASAHVSNSRFLSIGEGVHTDRCYVLVENCLFTDTRGDNDGVDMDGESDPLPVIRNNLFIGSRDDALHPDRTSAIITGNVVTGCGDHGIVLRNPCTPYLANNIIYNCGSAGIAIENQCQALLVNNTIVDCGRGLRLFHLEREGSAPGGGHGTVRNCIIWNCPQPITLADESTVTVTHSNVNGTQVWEGEGNINADPKFADADNGDFHLKKSSPCIDVGNEENAPPDDFDGKARPRGTGFDLGAYESPYWPFVDTDDDGMADEWEQLYFASLDWRPDDDFDGDGMNNLAEYDVGTDPSDPDTDADGLRDGAEEIAGTDPTDARSVFAIVEVTAVGDAVRLRWHATAGREYRVLVSTDQEVWTEVAIIPPGDDRLAEWLDDTSNEEPRRFYKLEVAIPSP